MQKLVKHFLPLLCICFGFINGNNPYDWEFKKYDNEIAIYTRSVKGSGFKELKAVTTFHSSLSGLVALLKDIPSAPTYVHHCKQSYIISSRGDSEIVFYQETAIDWPVSNRDVVIRYKIKQDKKTKTVMVDCAGIKNVKPEVDGNVRIPELKGYWKFSLEKNGNVQGEYCLYLDPGSSIPDWLSNMFLIDGPFNTISKMKILVSQKKYQSVNYNNILN